MSTVCISVFSPFVILKVQDEFRDADGWGGRRLMAAPPVLPLMNKTTRYRTPPPDNDYTLNLNEGQRVYSQ